MNNLEIADKIINLPNLIIKKSETWNYAIEIQLNTLEEINYFDTFLVLKSYCWNSVVPCYAIAFGKKDNTGNLVICEKETILKVRKIDYESFQDWLDWRISTDKKYEIKSTFYYILLLFEKKICTELKLNLEQLIPKLPWSDTWLKNSKVGDDKINRLKRLVEEKNNEIEKLKLELEKEKQQKKPK